MRVRGLIVVSLLVTLFVGRSEATPITYNYTGTVTGTPTGIFSGQGTNVTGTFTFDDALVDSQASSSLDLFDSASLANQSFNNVWSITLNLGAVSVTTATNVNLVGSSHHTLLFADNVFADQFQIMTTATFTGDDVAVLLLSDYPPPVPDAITAGTGGLTSTIAGAITILNSLDVADFDQSVGSWVARNSQTNAEEGYLQFQVTSISPAQAVPEPTSLLLFGTGLAAAGVRRYRRKK